MSNFTPGPWSVRQTIKGPYVVRGRDTLGEAAIAKILLRGKWADQAQANARFIAAAPMLYDHFRQLVASYASVSPINPQINEARELIAFIERGQ